MEACDTNDDAEAIAQCARVSSVPDCLQFKHSVSVASSSGLDVVLDNFNFEGLLFGCR